MRNIKKFLFAILLTGLFVGCTDKLVDMNVNPNNPTGETANLGTLLTSSIRKSFQEDRFEFWRGPIIQGDRFGHHFTFGFKEAAWWNESAMYDYNDGWNTAVFVGYFTDSEMNNNGGHIFPNLDLVIDKCEENNYEGHYMYYSAVAEIVRAFQFIKITDAYGDVPYTDVNDPEVYQPTYDNQEDIYADLEVKLKKAITDIGDVVSSGVGKENLTDYDPMFEGDLQKWSKFANALRFRMAMRSSNVNTNSDAIVADVLKYDLPEANDESALTPIIQSADYLDHQYHGVWMAFRSLGETVVEKDNGETVTVIDGPGAGSFAPSRCLVNIMTGQSLTSDMVQEAGTNVEMNPFFGVVDPRLSAYFDMSLIYDDYRGFPARTSYDDDGYPTSQFRSIYEFAQPNPSIYDGSHDLVTLAYAEVCFLRAEAALSSMSSESATEWYVKGVEASVAQWGADIGTYWSQAGTALTGNTDSDFEKIATQRWIASYCVPWQAWSVLRRTGYPAFANLDKTKTVNAWVEFDADGNPVSQETRPQYVQGETNYELPSSCAIPTGESLLNSNAPQTQTMTTKVWWDVN